MAAVRHSGSTLGTTAPLRDHGAVRVPGSGMCASMSIISSGRVQSGSISFGGEECTLSKQLNSLQ